MVVYNYSIISNKNRTSGTDSNFLIDKFNPPYSRFFRVRRAVFMNTIKNINPNNNTFTVKIGASAPVTITIPTGVYTTTNLLAALNTALTNIGGSGINIVATYPTTLPPANVYPITFTPTGTSVIIMNFTGLTSANAVLGFDKTTYTTTAPAAITAPYVLNLSYPSVLYLCSKALTSYDSQLDVPGTSVTDVLAILPVDSQYGYFTDVEIRTNFSIYPKQNKILDFQLRDGNNQVVDLGGAEIVFEILLTDTVEGLWGS